MPELKDRDQREATLSAALAALFDDQRARTSASGTSDYGAFEADLRRVLVHELQQTFVAAALILLAAMDDRDTGPIELQAVAWANGYAPELARAISANTRAAVDAATRGARAGGDGAAALEGRLASIFSRERADAIAITETTRAVSAGERAVVNQRRLAGGGQATAIWNTEADSKVCPICRPLHGLPEESYGDKFPGGPPAHVRCRCFLTYDLVSA